MTSPLLRVEHIHTYYGDAHILNGVSFEVPKGNCIAILGRNGVGKTTLARSIIGFTPPRRGRIIFDGIPIVGLPPRAIVRHGMAIVPQGRRIFASLSAEENLRIAIRHATAEPAASVWDLRRVYELFPRLEERKNRSANTLSGGEQQMLAIGRALLTGPKLLLLDEPTEGLAPIVIEFMVKALGELKRSGVSMLLLEQRVSVALQLADLAIAMVSHGTITFRGLPESIPIEDVESVSNSRVSLADKPEARNRAKTSNQEGSL
jgi:branched-chain amino acid transport system ATP-binding protein